MLFEQRGGHRRGHRPHGRNVSSERASASHPQTPFRQPQRPPLSTTQAATMGLTYYYSYGLPTFLVLVVALYLLFTVIHIRAVL